MDREIPILDVDSTFQKELRDVTIKVWTQSRKSAPRKLSNQRQVGDKLKSVPISV